MARIQEYVSDEHLGVANNAEAAGQAASGVYSGIASGLHSVGDAVLRFNQQQESSKLAVSASALHAQLTNEWEDLKVNGDITDPEQVQKFNDAAAERIDKLSDDIGSPAIRAHAAEVAQTLKSGFSIKTLADHATAVGDQAVTNLETMTNNYSASVYADPSSLDETAKLVGFSVAASGVPQNKVPELTVKITKKVATSAVDGMILNGNPQKALENLASGAYDKYFDGPEKAALVAKANTAIHAQQADARAAEVEARRKAKEEAGAISQKIIENMPVDANGHMRIYPGAFQDAQKIADPEQQRATLDFLKSTQAAQERPTPKASDPHTYQDLRERIFAPGIPKRPVTQQELMQAAAHGLLDPTDFNYLRHGLAGDDDPATKQFHTDVQRVLTGYKAGVTDSSLIKVNQYGDQRYSEFQRDLSAYAETVRSQLNAIDKVEAYARAILPRYQRTTDQNTDATTARVDAPLPALLPAKMRMPGESIADYTKRVGG